MAIVRLLPRIATAAAALLALAWAQTPTGAALIADSVTGLFPLP